MHETAACSRQAGGTFLCSLVLMDAVAWGSLSTPALTVSSFESNCISIHAQQASSDVLMGRDGCVWRREAD